MMNPIETRARNRIVTLFMRRSDRGNMVYAGGHLGAAGRLEDDVENVELLQTGS